VFQSCGEWEITASNASSIAAQIKIFRSLI